MDLKVFYQKVRQVEATLLDAHVIVVSLDTPDGGRAGVPTEAGRAVAARMIVEGKARLATPEEATAFRTQVATAKRAADQAASASRMQVTVISDADLRAVKGSGKKA
jgi:hypothetical protein